LEYWSDPDFGFWISEFGFYENLKFSYIVFYIKKSAIHNLKSEIESLQHTNTPESRLSRTSDSLKINFLLWVW
jgi:hypothetical protein